MIRRQNRHLEPAASETIRDPSWTRILYGKIQHSALGLSPKIARNAAPATKSDTPTSPNTAPATKNHSHDSWLILLTFETSFTMRGATRVTLQLHQILRLPRKMTPVIDHRHIWNAIYNGRSIRSHPPTSRNIAPATENDSAWLVLVASETLFTMRGATLVTIQHHQILRQMSAENPWIASANIKTMRPWSEDNPKIKSSSRTRRFGDLTRPILETHFEWKNTTFRAPAISQNFTKCCTCHEK